MTRAATQFLKDAHRLYAGGRRLVFDQKLKALGWQTGEFFAEREGMPLTRLYLHDFGRDLTLHFSVCAERFGRIAAEYPSSGLDAQQVRNAFTSLIYKRTELTGPAAAPVAESEPESDDEALALLCSLYLGTTRTFATMVDHLGARSMADYHFVVFNYRRPGSSESMLRPFVLGPTREVLSVGELFEFIQYARDGDEKNHPDWLRPDDDI